jgi:hypothetical protein
MDIDERCSPSEICDALAILEKLEEAELLSVREEIDRMRKTKGRKESEAQGPDGQSTKPERVSLGAKFLYRTTVILGAECASFRKPPFEGQFLTVVGFEPAYKNNVVIQDPNGSRSLMPLDLVEKALRFSPVRENMPGNRIPALDDALEFVRRADGSELNVVVKEIQQARKGLDVNAAAHLQVGDLVVCDPLDGGPQLRGPITKVYAGRVTIQTNLEGASKPCSVPASMVRIARSREVQDAPCGPRTN